MAKVTKKAIEPSTTAELPKITDEIFKLKIDKDTQKFFIDELEDYGQFDEFTLRVLDSANKLVAYNDDFEVKNETHLFKRPDEAHDAQGGIGCGRKLFRRETEGFSEDEKAANKAKANWYTLVFGIATVNGKPPVLIDFRIAGGAQIEANNILNKIKADKKEFHKAEIRVKAFKNDEFDWPKLEFTGDFSRELPVSGLEPLFDTVEAYIANHNEKIDEKAEKYKTYKAGRTSNGSSYKKNSTFKKKY